MAEEYLTDDEQLEAVKHFVTDNGAWILGGLVVGAALFFGYRFYQSRSNENALAAASAFSAVTGSLDAGQADKSRQLAAGLIKDYPHSAYADQARLVLARIAVDEGKSEEAVAPLKEVMEASKDTELRSVARVRLARLLIDRGKPEQALAMLAAPVPNGFATPFHEARGDAYAAKKDMAAAAGEYRAALAATDPSGVVGALLGLKLQDLGAAGEAVSAPVPDPKIKAKP